MTSAGVGRSWTRWRGSVGVQARWGLRGRVIKTYDYIEQPKPSGYRGVHLVARYDERRVEVQLRTEIQHEWAVAVERLGGRIGEDLKSGVGPAEVLDLLRRASEAMAVEEGGGQVPSDQVEAIRQARVRAEPFLVRKREP